MVKIAGNFGSILVKITDQKSKLARFTTNSIQLSIKHLAQQQKRFNS